MAVKYLAGNRLWGTDAERTGMAESFAPKTSWKQLAKTTLGSGGATAITVTSIPKKDNLWVLISTLESGTSPDLYISYGINDDDPSTDTDTSGVWSWSGRYGGESSESSGVSQAKMKINNTQNGYGGFWNLRIKNLESGSTNQKFTIARGGEYNDTVGIPMPQDYVGKFNRIDGYIDRIELTSQAATGDGSYTFPEGSEVVVLGCNDDEADNSTPNAPFWQQLTAFEVTGSAAVMDTGADSIAEKKYLMFEIFQEDNGGTIDAEVNFNDDTGTVYGYNIKSGGATGWTTDDNDDKLWGFGADQAGDKQGYAIFANISGHPKLGIMASTQASSAGSAGRRRRGCGKYSPSSLTDFISRVAITGTAGVGSTIRVWGGTPTS